MKNLILSYSMLDSLFDCEGIWYWKYIRELEKEQWKMEFLMGNMHHLSIYLLMSKDKDAEKKLMLAFDKEVKDIRKNFSLSIEDEQNLVEAKVILKGMHYGYANRYKKDLKIEKHIENESDTIYPIPGLSNVSVRIKLDNIIEAGKKWYLHEAKTWRSLSPTIVDNIKNNFQIAFYFHVHNSQKHKKFKPFSGVMFDAIQKPTIRKKSGEAYRGYLKRLEEYYQGADSNNKFYKEVLGPNDIKISSDKIFKSIDESVKRIREIQNGREPFLSFKKCSWCDYYKPCFEGATKQNLVGYKKRISLPYKGGK